MFKKGDIVVCIDVTGEGGDVKLYNTYTITDVYINYILLYDILWASNIKNFISLKEYRKRKLKKLNCV